MSHFGDSTISFFKNVATKIEELQVQGALGKAELEDVLEDFKKDARSKYNLLKSEVNTQLEKGGDKMNSLKAKLEHLELQLALGKAETKEAWAEQRKNISEAITDVKKLIEKD